MEFIIGGLAGAGATVFTNPIDVVKIRMQLQGELCPKSKLVIKYRGIFHAMYVIAKTDGPLALQKGLSPALVLGLTMNSVRLGLYDIADTQQWTRRADGAVSIYKAWFWSSFSGVLGGILGNPACVLKTRMQSAAHPTIAVGRQHKYKGMIDGCIQIYRYEGWRGFFSGLNSYIIRLCIGSAAQLTTFSKAKESLLFHGFFHDSPFSLAFGASLISGAMVAVTACPFDVITIRLYNQGPGKTLYSGMLDCAIKICKTEGLFGLYKGLFPLYCRIAPHTTLSLIIWDVLNDFWKKKETNKKNE